MSVLPIILQKKKLLGAKLNQEPPSTPTKFELPEGTIVTANGDLVVMTSNSEGFILTVNGFVSLTETQLLTGLDGNPILTDDGSFISNN